MKLAADGSTVKLRSLVLAAGVAVTAFVLFAVAVIEIVRVDPGAGILGVGVGAVAAAVAFAAIATRPRAALGPRGPIETIAGFGWALVLLFALSYVNVPVISAMGGVEIGGVALVLAVAVGAVARLRGRGRPTRREGTI